MSGRPSISAYTPSNTAPEMLKRIFVQRDKLLEKIVDRLARSMTTGDKHHILLVGPRGSGKTHLVSLAAWELQRRGDLSDIMRIAWLGEDDSFTGLIHLAFGVARQLADEYPDEFPADFKEQVRGLSQEDAALSVLNSIVEQLQNRSLVLITENMDQTFRGLGDSGQKIWRAFLQETRKIATLATTQQLFAGVSDRNEAFFGFFDIQHLKPLTVEEAGELIRRISVVQKKPELVQYLNSAEGRFRIRALHYLAGGNHRMYVLLAEFLTKDSLDDLVAAFESLAHDMTPYFQERVRSLPDQQKQLVQCLCDVEGALTVKGIAEETFIDERSCSKQLGNLKMKGYVRSEKRGKESYYDMAEPLMRLCLEVKNQRGRPLKMVARFLRAWFPVTALQAAEGSGNGSVRVGAYYREAMQTTDLFQSTIAGKLTSEIRNTLAEGRYQIAENLVEELRFADGVSALWVNAEVAFHQGDMPRVIAELTRFIDRSEIPAAQKALALNNRGNTYGEQGEIELALLDYTAVVDMPDAPVEQKASALNGRGVTRWQRLEFVTSQADFDAVLHLPDAPAQERTVSLFAVPEPMIDHCNRSQVLEALHRAFKEGDPQFDVYGGTPHDLLWMVLRRGPSEWADYVADLTPLFVRYNVAEKLGQGVTKSIQHLDEGGYSESQLDTWNAAWQAAGKDCDDLQIPLKCLDSAVEVMKSDPKTDRPLFKLPLEIRKLVRPLLNKSLGRMTSS